MNELKTMQFTGGKEGIRRLEEFMPKHSIEMETTLLSSNYVDVVRILTREGDQIVTVGDYIVEDVDGVYSIYNPDLFHRLYDIV